MAQRASYVFIDGQKAVNLTDLDSFLDYLISADGQVVTEKAAWASVPWVYRGIKLRAQAVGAMPFNIYRGDTIIDEYGGQASYENKNGILPHPGRLFSLVEAALTALGYAYLVREANRVKTTGLRYLLPTSIEPVISEQEGLTGWKRQLNGKTVYLKLEEIVHFWDTDWAVEYGPPKSSPLKAALMAAGVLIHVDEFVNKFTERGMVKATLLTVPRGTAPEEKNRLVKWWKQVTGGTSQAWGTHILEAETVTPTVIGEGLKELENVELTDDKRKDIGVALGVPSTILFSGDAGGLGGSGVVRQDDIRFYRDTIVPECQFIAGVMNELVFDPLGLRLAFKPETLDIFQADEKERSFAFANYVNAGMTLSVTAQMLGLELPEGIEYDALDEMKPKPQPFPAFGMAPGGEGSKDEDAKEDEDTDAVRADLRLWERVALRRLDEGKGAAYDFVSEIIPPGMKAEVLAALETATTGEEVRAAFAASFRQGPWQHYP